MPELKSLLVQIKAATGISASLYQGGRTLHSPLSIGVDDRDSSNHIGSERTSKFGSRSPRAELLHKLALIIIHDTSMMEHKLFDLVNVTIKELRCSESWEHRFRFGGVTVVFTWECLQLLPVISLRGWSKKKMKKVAMSMVVYSISFLGLLNSGIM